MTDSRPGAAALRQLVIDDLATVYGVAQVDATGFTLERAGKVVRVAMSAAQMDGYLDLIEESAHGAMGLEPGWASAVSLAAVHVLEEVAMAEPGMSVVLDGDVIRRDPAPGAGDPPTPSS